MIAPLDPALLGGAVTLIGAVAVWLFHRVVKKHDDEIASLKTRQDSKDDRIERDMEEVFRRLRELEICTARIEEQLLRFASDIESEKRTRADVNRELNGKLDRLLDRLTGSHR